MLLESYCRKEYRAGAPPCVRRGHCLSAGFGLAAEAKCVSGRFVVAYVTISYRIRWRIVSAGCQAALLSVLRDALSLLSVSSSLLVSLRQLLRLSLFLLRSLLPVQTCRPLGQRTRKRPDQSQHIRLSLCRHCCSACRHPGGRTPRVYGAASAQRRPLRSALAQRRLFALLLFAQGQCSRTLLALPEEAFQSFY